MQAGASHAPWGRPSSTKCLASTEGAPHPPAPLQTAGCTTPGAPGSAPSPPARVSRPRPAPAARQTTARVGHGVVIAGGRDALEAPSSPWERRATGALLVFAQEKPRDSTAWAARANRSHLHGEARCRHALQLGFKVGDVGGAVGHQAVWRGHRSLLLQGRKGGRQQAVWRGHRRLLLQGRKGGRQQAVASAGDGGSGGGSGDSTAHLHALRLLPRYSLSRVASVGPRGEHCCPGGLSRGCAELQFRASRINSSLSMAV